MNQTLLTEVKFRTSRAISTVYIQSEEKKRPLDERILEILEFCHYGLMHEIGGKAVRCLSMNQIQFLVKATGDWDSDNTQIILCVWKLVDDRKLSYSPDSFCWKQESIVSHES